jgi:hypothetical protein
MPVYRGGHDIPDDRPAESGVFRLIPEAAGFQEAVGDKEIRIRGIVGIPDLAVLILPGRKMFLQGAPREIYPGEFQNAAEDLRLVGGQSKKQGVGLALGGNDVSLGPMIRHGSLRSHVKIPEAVPFPELRCHGGAAKEDGHEKERRQREGLHERKSPGSDAVKVFHKRLLRLTCGRNASAGSAGRRPSRE